MKTQLLTLLLALPLVAMPGLFAQDGKNGIWIDPKADSLPVAFGIQGEFVGEIDAGDGKKAKIGCQVIHLGGDVLQAVLLPGGLPGDGWDGKHKMLMDGNVEAPGGATFIPAAGNKGYLAKDPKVFSATRKFPPDGQQSCNAVYSGGKLVGKVEDGRVFELKKTLRKSPTLGATAPEGAKVLFDGTNSDAWNGGRVDATTKFLNTDSKDINSKTGYASYQIHLEFMLPYRPDGRGQGRGNSGFYQSDGNEVQVLDSFGLDGLKNECGAVYNKAAPSVNMCFPPLTWQTYDIELLRNDGKTTITVLHNGVKIHDKLAGNGGNNVRHFTLQGHGNPLQFRNIWIVEKKE